MGVGWHVLDDLSVPQHPLHSQGLGVFYDHGNQYIVTDTQDVGGTQGILDTILKCAVSSTYRTIQ